MRKTIDVKRFRARTPRIFLLAAGFATKGWSMTPRSNKVSGAIREPNLLSRGDSFS